jgi:hypothetical protein
MSSERVVHLEQALVAMPAAAEQLGFDSSHLCRTAIGGLIANTDCRWVIGWHVPNPVDEIKSAVRVLHRE